MTEVQDAHLVGTVQSPGTPNAAASSDVRWGGAVVALAAATFIVTIFLYAVVYGQPTGTGADGEVTSADAATHTADRWWFISKVWMAEAVAMVLLAVAAFALQRRALQGPSWFPTRVAWSAVAVGALLQSAMYAFMLGAYPAALAERDTSLVLYDAMRGGATFLFYLSNAALYLGLAGVFVAEGAPEGVFPKWLALAGGIIGFAVALLMLLLIAGIGSMMMAAPGALVGFLVAVYLGFAIWRSRSPDDGPHPV